MRRFNDFGPCVRSHVARVTNSLSYQTFEILNSLQQKTTVKLDISLKFRMCRKKKTTKRIVAGIFAICITFSYSLMDLVISFFFVSPYRFIRLKQYCNI